MDTKTESGVIQTSELLEDMDLALRQFQSQIRDLADPDIDEDFYRLLHTINNRRAWIRSTYGHRYVAKHLRS